MPYFEDLEDYLSVRIYEYFAGIWENGIPKIGECTFTDKTFNPWWDIDLEEDDIEIEDEYVDNGVDGSSENDEVDMESGDSDAEEPNEGNVNSSTAPALEFSVGHGLTEGIEGHPHHAIETQDGGFAVIGETSVGERMTSYLLVTDAFANVIFKLIDIAKNKIFIIVIYSRVKYSFNG